MEVLAASSMRQSHFLRLENRSTRRLSDKLRYLLSKCDDVYEKILNGIPRTSESELPI